jgi:hypothetical protein
MQFRPQTEKREGEGERERERERQRERQREREIELSAGPREFYIIILCNFGFRILFWNKLFGMC